MMGVINTCYLSGEIVYPESLRIKSKTPNIFQLQISTKSVSFASSKCCLRSSFRIGDKVNLINPGSSQGGHIDDAEFDKDMQPRFKVKLPDGRVENATVEQL